MDNLIALISASSAIIVAIVGVVNGIIERKHADARAKKAEEEAKEREERLIKESKDTEQSEQISIQSKALKNLLWDRLDQLCNYCIGQGKISRSQHKKMEAMYDSYKQLGGNGDMEFLKSKVEELPIAKEDER